MLLISRLINRSGLRIFHSKVFSSGNIRLTWILGDYTARLVSKYVEKW